MLTGRSSNLEFTSWLVLEFDTGDAGGQRSVRSKHESDSALFNSTRPFCSASPLGPFCFFCFWRCLVLGGLLSGQSSLLIVDFLFELLSPFSFVRLSVPPTLAYCLFNKQRLRLRRRRRRLQRAKESNEWRKLARSKRGLEPMQWQILISFL